MKFPALARHTPLFACLSAIAVLPAAVAEAQPAISVSPIEDERVVYAPTAGWDPSEWDLEDSEFRPEDGWVFGTLDNGMRYIIRPNDRPEGTALVRMVIKTGSIDERDDELGFAHFVEHMAFNGSTNVPEGEMIKLLERKGLAFGADTNASTGFDRTEYKLDLPRADDDLLDTALMLMRETASELTITPEAVERERGVILSERRVRNNYNLKNIIDSLEFAFPDARIPTRIPIGTLETLEAASAEGLRTFWQREYVPGDTTLIIIGDFDPQAVERKVTERFAGWTARETGDQSPAGPVDYGDAGRTAVYLDPALTETITILRHAPFIERADTVEQRRVNVLRTIADNIVSRRLQRLLRSDDPPFRSASFGTNDFFEVARTSQITVATVEGEWQRGLNAAIDEYRRALEYGFTEAEIDEQLRSLRTGFVNAVTNASTRSNQSHLRNAMLIARGDLVPDHPRNALARFDAVASEATPDNVLAAYRENLVALDNPLIRFSGKSAPEGGEAALREAVEQAFAREITPPEDKQVVEFAYTDFGAPGTIASDTLTPEYEIRTIRFENGVMLNLKQTDLAADQISVRVAVDGGQMLSTRDNPAAVALASLLTNGGLGRHSLDELQSILAGQSVSARFSAGDDAFVGSGSTTRANLDLQLQLLAAFITDPGYRSEGLGPWKRSLEDFYARIGKTPGSAYGEVRFPRLTDNDPRFVRPPIEFYQGLDYTHLQGNIADRLANGAIEIAIVGDFNEQLAIDYVAQTFGALPAREESFRSYDDERRILSVTADRSDTVVRHDGEPDQAMVRYVWPTNDNDDWVETSQFELLTRIVQLMLTDSLREELGQTYSPMTNSSMSDRFESFGTFEIGASVDVAQVDAVKAAMDQTLERLLAEAPDEDLIDRARQPIFEALDNRLKTNGSWMGIVERAQSKPGDLERFRTTRDRYEAMTGEDLLMLARKYLQPDKAIAFTVLPRDPVVGETSQD